MPNTAESLAFHAGWVLAREGLPIAACRCSLERQGWRMWAEAHGHA